MTRTFSMKRQAPCSMYQKKNDSREKKRENQKPFLRKRFRPFVADPFGRNHIAQRSLFFLFEGVKHYSPRSLTWPLKK